MTMRMAELIFWSSCCPYDTSLHAVPWLGLCDDGWGVLCWRRTGLVGVMRLDSWAALSVVPGAVTVSFADGRPSGLIVGVLYFILCSLTVPGL